MQNGRAIPSPPPPAWQSRAALPLPISQTASAWGGRAGQAWSARLAAARRAEGNPWATCKDSPRARGLFGADVVPAAQTNCGPSPFRRACCELGGVQGGGGGVGAGAPLLPLKTNTDFFHCRSLSPAGTHSPASISERCAQAVPVLHRERGGQMEQPMGSGRKTTLELLLLGAAGSRTAWRAAGRAAELRGAEEKRCSLLQPSPEQRRGWGMDGAGMERRRGGGSGVRAGGSACP